MVTPKTQGGDYSQITHHSRGIDMSQLGSDFCARWETLSQHQKPKSKCGSMYHQCAYIHIYRERVTMYFYVKKMFLLSMYVYNIYI